MFFVEKMTKSDVSKLLICFVPYFGRMLENLVTDNMLVIVSLTSAADTNESVEAMLLLSLRQASSSSSLAKMSAILSVMENNHCDVFHYTVLYECTYYIYPVLIMEIT